MAEKYGEYFTAFQDAISGFVKLVKDFVATIQNFVKGFKKTITTGEDFKDSDED